MKGNLVIESEEGIKEYELDKKDLNAIKTLIVEREKVVMLANPANVREAQGKDKLLKRMHRLEWWTW
jgi:hypothetical protein